MTGWDGVHLPHGFWNEVWRAGKRLLLLDYDGTLVPFRTDREKARPSPEVVEMLSSLAVERGGLSVLSYGIAERCFEIARDYAGGGVGFRVSPRAGGAPTESAAPIVKDLASS